MNKINFLILILFLFISCFNQNAHLSSNNVKKMAMLVHGSLEDKSFNESALEGLKRLKEEYGLEFVAKESQANFYSSDLEALKDSGADLIWMIGYQMSPIALSSSLENLEIKMAVVDAVFEENLEYPKNLISLSFKVEDAAFLAGYIASTLAKQNGENKIGFIGGIEGTIVDAFRYGYSSGAKYANPEIEIISQYAESFTDVMAGRTIANKMFQDGIRIIHHAAGLVGLGAIEAAKELGDGYWIIGVDQDQSYLAPNNILTSVYKNVGQAIYNISSAYLSDNKWQSGKIVQGLKDKAVGIVKNTSKLNKEITNQINKIEKNIIDKKIIVPSNREEYNIFISNL